MKHPRQSLKPHEHDWLQGRRSTNVLSLKCRVCPAIQLRPDVKPGDVDYTRTLVLIESLTKKAKARGFTMVEFSPAPPAPTPRAQQKRYTPEQKAAAIELSEKIGMSAVQRHLGIPISTVARWMLKAGRPLGQGRRTSPKRSSFPKKRRHSYTKEQRAAAIELAQAIGQGATAKQLGIPESNICKWTQMVGKSPGKGSRVSEQRERRMAPAIELAQEVGQSAVAKQLGIPQERISYWMRKAGVGPGRYSRVGR